MLPVKLPPGLGGSFWFALQARSKDVQFDPREVRRLLIENDYQELTTQSQHVVMVDSMPPIHKDPFDRILIAQAMVEGITLLTADPVIAKYPGPIRKV